MNIQYCAEHGEVEAVDDNGIDRCPVCEKATSFSLEEALRYETQEEEPTVGEGER